MKQRISGLLWVAFFFSVGTSAQTHQFADTAIKAQGATIRMKAAADCIFAPIAPGDTFAGQIDISDCESQNFYVDFYEFSANAGQSFTAEVLSTDLNPILVAIQDVSTGTVLASNNGSLSVSVSFTAPATGSYLIGVGALGTFGFGSYVVSLTAGGSGGGGGGGGRPGGCSQSSTNLCLDSSRFKVSARWTKTDGTSGSGTAVSLTGDTGYFWFFSSSNVEMVIKVLEACSINEKRWVFSGGLTNVQTVITVTDTTTNTTRTYTNPQSTEFQPIQDTAAFPCN